MDARHIAELCGGMKAAGEGFVCKCPAHEDKHASLSLKNTPEGKLLFKCHAGCDQMTVMDAIKRIAGNDVPLGPRTFVKAHGKETIVATYDYTDEYGALAYQVLRMEPKTFRQRRKARPDDPPDKVKFGWVWNLNNTTLYPYNLATISQLPMQKAVIVVEGEKDVENLRKLGVVATCNSSGAGKWRPEFAKYFRGRTIIIIPDNDPAGRNHAIDVWHQLDSIASKIRILELPDLNEKEDVSDWIARGGTRDTLLQLVVKAIGENQTKPAKPIPEPRQLPAPEPEPAPAPKQTNVVQLKQTTQAKPLADPCAAFGPEYSDIELAAVFAEQWKDKLLYVSAFNAWYFWDNTRWAEDGKLRVNAEMRDLCAATAANAMNDPSIGPLPKRKTAAANLASAKKISNVIAVAKSDRGLAADHSQWDNNKWILNTPSGAINLHDGSIHPANARDYATKITSCSANPGPYTETCPTWLTFMDSVCLGNQSLIDYLQRVIGYSLTGSTSEHSLFFIYGSGANGKSTFLQTIGNLLGDYTAVASMETFVASANERHSTELARLRGARFVSAQETEEGRRWAEAKIKELTGGDKIIARLMRQDFFEFTPQFKLLIAGNHKPTLRNVDEAMRRRFHLIPFTANIPPEKRDHQLPAKLAAEAGGILQWAIDGCLKWQKEGLGKPEIVAEATEAYFRDEDVFGSWLDICCTLNPAVQSIAQNLYRSFSAYAEAQGEYVISQKRFIQMLENRDLAKKRTSTGTVFAGICLQSDSPRQSTAGFLDD